jgi:hypothetical protein
MEKKIIICDECGKDLSRINPGNILTVKSNDTTSIKKGHSNTIELPPKAEFCDLKCFLDFLGIHSVLK